MPDLWDYWPAPTALRSWHDAISDLWIHTDGCTVCRRAREWDHQPRCDEGQALYHAEQTAYGAHLSNQYAGKAVA